MAPTPTAMTNMPPTWRVIREHIKRAFYVVRKVVDHTANELDCCQFGWENAGGGPKPSKCMNPLPPDILITCKCTGKCESRRCMCKKSGVKCVIDCHKTQGVYYKNNM